VLVKRAVDTNRFVAKLTLQQAATHCLIVMSVASEITMNVHIFSQYFNKTGFVMNEKSNKPAAKPQLEIMIVPVTPFQQNCTLLKDQATNKVAIVDPGGDVELLLQALKEIGGEPEKILITHGHIDHVGGVVDLKDKLNIPVEGPHRDDNPLIQRLDEQASMFGSDTPKAFTPDRWLNDQESVTVGSCIFDVYHCPGHAPGHVIFVQKDMKFALLGDVLFQGSIGRTDLPGGDYKTLMQSIFQKVLPLGDDIQFLCGHGQGSTIGHERITNPFLQE
jgi:hydroxyacylglutathione hydrolase